MTTTTASTDVSTSHADRWRRRVRGLVLDSGYVLVCFPLAIVAFCVVITGLATGAGLLITFIGLPIIAVTLYAARALAATQRGLARMTGESMPAPAYRRADPGDGLLRRLWVPLTDPQLWLDCLHGVLVFPVATATFCVVVTWWSAIGGGLTHWIWSPFLPHDQKSSWALTVLDSSITQFVFGLIALATIIPVVRFCVMVQNGLARLLLANPAITQLRGQVDRLTQRRSAAAHAEVDSLRRLERDLHDGPQQRLVRLGMDLAAAERRLDGADPASARQLVDQARRQTTETLAELRALTRGFAPPILTDRGLGPAVEALAARCTVPTTVQCELGGARLSAPVETAAYFVVSEALTNVAKHAGARRAWVEITRDGQQLIVVVTDDGRGGAAVDKGHGLRGLSERVTALDGRLELDSPPGGPTTLWTGMPCG